MPIIEEGKKYFFKTEFCNILGIPKYQIERRKADLMIWLSNFFDYEYITGRPDCIYINAILGDYQPMPRKVYDQALDKQKYYDDYVKNHFSLEFAPNSKMKMSRGAIADGARAKWGHASPKNIAYTYIKGPFEKYGENNNVYIWAYYSTYKPLDQAAEDRWHAILQRENIDEEQAANAFYCQEQGDDISEQKAYYKNALEAFFSEYGDLPVRVQQWRLKREFVEIK